MGLFSNRRNPVLAARSDGQFDLVLEPRLRETARLLLDELDQLLEDPDDPSLRRLSPPAYPDLPEQDEAYRLLAGSELVTSRHMAISRSIEAIERATLSENEAWAWLQSLNALRLVVGTRLEITDDDHRIDLDPDHPDAPLWSIYEFTTWLQASVVEALRGS